MARAIDQFLADIRQAIYGRDVREAIASGIEQCYNDSTASAQKADIEAKGAEVLASIPDTYEDLQNNVNNLKSAVNSVGFGSAFYSLFSSSGEAAYIKGYYIRNDGIVVKSNNWYCGIFPVNILFGDATQTSPLVGSLTAYSNFVPSISFYTFDFQYISGEYTNKAGNTVFYKADLPANTAYIVCNSTPGFIFRNVKSIYQKITDNSSLISGLRSDVTDIQGDITTIQNDTTGLHATTDTLNNDISQLKIASIGEKTPVLSDRLAGYIKDSGEFVPEPNWRSMLTNIGLVTINGEITISRGTLYGYNSGVLISSIGFFDADMHYIDGKKTTVPEGTVFKRTDIPANCVYVAFNTTNVNAGFDIACNPLYNLHQNLKNQFDDLHVKKCTLNGTYDGGFDYKQIYVKKGDIVTINATYNGNVPTLFLSDGLRNNQWIPYLQVESTYFNTGYYVPETGWAGFTGWAATETGEKAWRFDITVFTPRNITEPMREIVVAASNSSADEKASADLVCNGTDDAAVINDAITIAQRIGVPDVVLCNGTFNINSYVEYNLQGIAKKVAILVHDALGKEGITLRGRKTGILPHGTILNVQESIFDNVGNDTLSIISGGAPDAGYQGSHGFNVRDLKIVLPNAQHKCIAINMQHAYWGMVENCYLQCTGYGQGVVPVDGCIGFRGWAGWSDGSNIGVNDTYAFGFRVGFQLGGEHVICERLGTRYCYYGYTFGEYPLAANSGAQVHPITLINCCDEHSAALPKFCDSGNADDRGAGRCAVDMISFIVEAYPLTNSPLIYAEESTPGGWVGRIDYTIENNEKNSSVSLPFWKSGHGLYFRTTNSAQLAAGTTAERANYAPNLAQTYYDTTLKKLLVYNGSAWVDANGTAV